MGRLVEGDGGVVKRRCFEKSLLRVLCMPGTISGIEDQATVEIPGLHEAYILVEESDAK